MATYTQVTKQLGDLWVDALKRAEDSVTTTSRTRTRPTVRSTARRRVFGQEMPTMHEVVEANFELAERVLKAQKHYALKAVEATFPEAPKPTATHPARKPAARKARSRARSRPTPVAHA